MAPWIIRGRPVSRATLAPSLSMCRETRCLQRKIGVMTDFPRGVKATMRTLRSCKLRMLQSCKRCPKLSESRWMPIMRKWTRRRFLKGVLLPAALGTLPRRAVQGEEPDGSADSPPDIIDTNVHLFDWPFRKLKYARTKA